MEFLSSSVWWAYMTVTGTLLAIFLVTRLKVPGQGWAKLIAGNITGWGSFAMIGLAFLIMGWQAGLGIFVGTNIIYTLARAYSRWFLHRASAAGK